MSDSLFDDPEICQAVLMDYYRNPRCSGVCQEATHAAEGRNPACGDMVKLSFRIGEGGRILEARTTGAGCAVSQASASLLMERLQGQTLEGAGRILQAMDRLLGGGGLRERDKKDEKDGRDLGGADDELEHLGALRLITGNAARVRCAQVAREAALEALGKDSGL